jgi:hypothetical protein
MQAGNASQAAEQRRELQTTETVSCGLIIMRHDDSQVLLLRADDSYCLPRVEIPRRQRAAPNLLPKVRGNWGVEAICRFSLPVEGISADGAERRYFVLDALNSECIADGETAWVLVGDIDWANFDSIVVRDRVYAAIAQAKAHDAGEAPGIFVRTGWFSEVTAWVQSQLDAERLRLSGGWEQYNMGPNFSLIRYETDGPTVWFKAVGEPCLREYAITSGLAELRSVYLPKLVATHSAWHGWLMFDGSGHHLDEVWDLSHWKTAASSLAELQLESVTHCESLIAAGCEDLRICELRRLIEPFLRVVARFMEMQPSNQPRILDAADLRFVEGQLISACRELEALGLPDTLGNTDLNPGNILIGDERAVFIDWMQGNVSHPFLTFEYLLTLLRRLRPDLSNWLNPIREAYCCSWLSISSARQMERALEFTPLLAILAFGVACTGWDEEVYGIRPGMAKLIRSLARRMFLEAQGLRA